MAARVAQARPLFRSHSSIVDGNLLAASNVRQREQPADPAELAVLPLEKGVWPGGVVDKKKQAKGQETSIGPFRMTKPVTAKRTAIEELNIFRCQLPCGGRSSDAGQSRPRHP
jgi:hypothetical protein